MGLSEKELETINENNTQDNIDTLENKKSVVDILESSIKSTSTDVFEKENDIIKNIGIKLITKSNLSEDQQKIALNIYDNVKKTIEPFISNPDINISVKITKVLGQIIKHLETTHIHGKIINGADKKIVAINLGRTLITEKISDEKTEKEILMLYDMIAEPTLETMIDVSKVVNVFVKEIATKCCPSFMNFIGLIKSFK